MKVPDNGFISLERFQNEAGAGERAWLAPDPAAANGDWLRSLTHSRSKEGRFGRSGCGNKITEIDQISILPASVQKHPVTYITVFLFLAFSEVNNQSAVLNYSFDCNTLCRARWQTFQFQARDKMGSASSSPLSHHKTPLVAVLFFLNFFFLS